MANLKIHYQINDFQLTQDSNFKGSNFIFKMTSSIPFDLPDGNLGINTEYRVYQNEQDMIDGFLAFKCYANGKRVKNMENFSLEPWGNEFSTDNYTQVQMAIINEYFGVPLEKITVVADTMQ